MNPDPRTNLKIAIGLLLCIAPQVWAQDARYRDGRFLETVGAVTIQRADDATSDEAVRNMPFLPGDRVWTDDSSRAEIVFADGEVLWIAERSKVDSLGRGGREQDERLGLRVFAGSFGARVRSGGPGFEFHAPGGNITTTGAAGFRVDIRTGETTITVSEGEVLADLGGERLSLRGGERLRYAAGRVDGPFQYQSTNGDSFDRWCDERSADLLRIARRDNRLPDELDGYSGELERNGDWVYDEPQGYVYVPRVSAGWAPYTYGRWVYTFYGWTWVADEPWGFVTSHYGRWGYSTRVGWHWMPRVGFAGAWVGWATPLGSWDHTIGWCALGFNERPISSFGRSYDRGPVPRGDRSTGPDHGWSFVNRTDMARTNVARRRVDLPSEEAARSVVWNAGSAPDRELRESRRTAEGSRGRGADDQAALRAGRGQSGDNRTHVYVRPTPGDSTPELRSDPTTTIPTPESRRQKTIGKDGFKEEQNDRRSRTRREDQGISANEGGSVGNPDPSRPRQPERTAPDSRPRSGDSVGASKDPLLSRFFRSITKSDSAERDGGKPPVDDASARRPRTRSGDDSSARDDNSRQKSRPTQDENRGGSRPAGAGHPEPRPAPPPQASPKGGNSDQHAAKRHQDGA